jgi:hypothetical protein
MYWPENFDTIDFNQFQTEQSSLILLAHGAHDKSESWLIPLQQAYNKRQHSAQVMPLNWSNYAQTPLNCAIKAGRIGKLLGEEILISKNLNNVHLIGHSCGAFVIYAACKAIKETNNNIVVQTTYLDPLSINGINWRYGLDHFGTCADYSEAYIDTEDGVIGSNELLPHTHTYDVTAVRKATNSSSSPHNWPTMYYLQLVTAGIEPNYAFDKTLADKKPRGILEVVKQAVTPSH